MSRALPLARRWYALYAGAVSLLQHPLLLACRLYWGSTFIQTGHAKLSNLQVTAEHFHGWHIPAPYPNAVAAGVIELVCGSLLMLGLASRIVSVPLVVVMIVAYLTAHAGEVTNIYTFVTAPPFLNMFTCVLVLVIGPGMFSVDYLLGKFVFGKPPEPNSGKGTSK